MRLIALLSLLISLFVTIELQADIKRIDFHAMPPCSMTTTGLELSYFDLNALVRKGSLCIQINDDLFDRNEIKLLMNNGAIVQIHSERSALNRDDLANLALVGKFMLLVEGQRYSANDLEFLAEKGIQIVIRLTAVDFDRYTLVRIAQRGSVAILKDTDRLDRSDWERLLEVGVLLL